ncbi:MAG: hypothetical protein Q9163_006007 [Psora crenata]
MMGGVVCNYPIDPSKAGKYPISISDDLLGEDDGPRKRQRIGVQYNYKPTGIEGQQATIKPSSHGQNGSYELFIKGEEGNGGYRYEGSQRASEVLVLIYHPDRQGLVLDRIDTEFWFNLRSTPSNTDAASLASRHPQLDTARLEGDGEDLFGDADGDGEEDSDDVAADPLNPYDYRHFLRRGASPSPEPSTLSPSVRNTPPPPGNSPLLAPSSPAGRSKPQIQSKKPSKVRQAQPPSPRLHEEADTDNEDSDPDKLVIDMGDSASTSRPWRSALGVLNEGWRKGGPISLGSAASAISPSIREESEDEEEEEEEDKSNQEVEEIDLGIPQTNVTSPSAAEEGVVPPGIGWDDDDDGILEAELEQALEEQAENDQRDQGNGAMVVAMESSSESEEE